MMDSTETPEHLDRLLADARAALQSFEDSVDHGRLMLRLRTASPAHPVLLARFLFAMLGFLCMVGGVVVLVIGTLNNDLARKIASFENVLPAPEGIPAVPSMLAALALWWGICWIFATFAARGLGRDAQMLPWEQQQHQKLVNEVTRLTTQKAVMERIRATPAGARPRIATPVPGIRSASAGSGGSALSRNTFNRTPAGAGAFGGAEGGYNTPTGGGYSPAPTGGFASSGYGSSPQPSSNSQGFGSSSGFGASNSGFNTPAGAPASSGFGSSSSNSGFGGGFGGNSGFGGGFGNSPQPTSRNDAPSVPASPAGYTAPSDYGGFDAQPSSGFGKSGFSAPGEAYADEEDSEEDEPAGGIRMGVGGGVRLGVARVEPAAEVIPALDVGDIVERGVISDGPPEPPPEPEPFAAGGILSKARSGATGSRATPYGSAGRVRVAPKTPARSPGPLGRNTRGGTPLGAAPRASASSKARLAAPLSFPGGSPSGSQDRAKAGDMFGTPPPLARSTGAPTPATPAVMSYSSPPTDEVVVMEEEDDYDFPSPPAASATIAPVRMPSISSSSIAPTGGPSDLTRRVPQWGNIDDPWLQEALAKAEALVQGYPAQAYIEFSQEPHLPFTLVIARATPAMAVRAMVNFVEFLASIYTPPRARIELVSVAHLDRSFDQNVLAALEPYFGANVEVEADPGRVDILFTDPDPGWAAYPTLPIQQ